MVTDNFHPRLQVHNAAVTGGASSLTTHAIGTVTYRFDWSPDPAFPALNFTGTVSGIAEGSGGDTAFDMPVTPALAVNTTYYWRAQATDGTVTSPYSSVSTFKTPALTPGITSLTVSSPRVEAELSVQLAASVVDAETVGQVTYEWSVAPARGTFSGSGRIVTWTSPRGAPSPDIYTITLNVTETFTGFDGQTTQVKGAPKSVIVHYNDSYRDIKTKGDRYLTQLFPNSSVSPAQAVQDFSDSCPGKAAERSDVVDARANFRGVSGTFNGTVTLSPDLTTGVDIGRCVFVDIPTNRSNPNFGKQETVPGTCTLTAVYENWDWFLCDSSFSRQGR